MNNEISSWSLVEAADAIAKKEISSEELIKYSLDSIDKWNSSINAFLNIEYEEALSLAKAADKKMESRSYTPGLLHGVPLAHKDLFYRKGKVLTCGSKVFNEFIPNFDSTILSRLHSEEGAINVGTLNMAEIAVGASGRNEHFGHCRNPWDTKRMTGGSSSGSGAAVAARNIFGSLGTDTGGSVRIPSSACGLVGIKGTYGRVSRHGVMPLSYTLDNAGPMTRTVRDCARMFKIIAGKDINDPLTCNEPVPDYESLLDEFNIKGKKIGIPSSYFYENVEDSVWIQLQASLDLFKQMGAEIVNVDVPDQLILRDMTNLILKSEVANIHKDWIINTPEKYQKEVLSRIESGLFIPATDYIRAMRLRSKHLKEFVDLVFDKCDVLHTPSLPIEPPTLEEIDLAVQDNALSINEKLPWCTRPLNYLGLPGISIPCGFSTNNMPVGFQLIGRPFSESLLFQFGHFYQKETDWHNKFPLL
ncbi:amidase [Alphaproteobacteria bacterium]|nr:amidase [Alphaproteobacteria bacterium]